MLHSLLYSCLDGNWFGLIQMLVQKCDYLMELDSLITAKEILQLAIQIDKASILSVLQSVLLDVLPEGCDDMRSRLLLNG